MRMSKLESEFWTALMVSALASGLTARLQGQRLPQTDGPRIFSGQDVGFRVEGRDLRTGNPTGTWMVRINGDWVAVGASPSIIPAK